MTTGVEMRDKPGRLTDSKWWFCEIGQHDNCATEIELTSRFEGCPCECHQTVETRTEESARYFIQRLTGRFKIHRRGVAGSGVEQIATADSEEDATLIVGCLNSFETLVQALENLVAADNCNYDREVMRSEGYFDAARLALDEAKQIRREGRE